jgi:hypothetical protein
MNSDSGVVTRMCGGRLSMAVRAEAGVSPVRTWVRLERRDIDDRRLVRQPVLAQQGAADQVVDRREEGREGLP